MKNKFLFALLLFFSSLCFAKNITNGIINYEIIGGGHNLIRLSGDWEFYQNQTFTTLMGAQLKIDFINVPGSWTKPNFENVRRPSMGCNTYRVVINGLRANYNYAIFSRHTPRYASRVYSNGMFIAEFGSFSRHVENYSPSLEVMKCDLKSNERGVIELVFQVANFSGGGSGILFPIVFGEKSHVERLYGNVITWTASLCGAILFLLIMLFMLWVFKKDEISYLGFVLLLFTLFIRTMFYGFNYFEFFNIPIPFALQYKTANFFLFDAGIFALLFLHTDRRSTVYTFIEKTVAIVSLALFTVFLCVPVRIAFAVQYAAYLWAGLFAVYCIVRMVDAFRHGFVSVAVWCILYDIISIFTIVDFFIYSPAEDTLWTMYELASMLAVVIDIIYVGLLFEFMLKKSIGQKNSLSNFYIAYRKFIPQKALTILGQPSLTKISVGSNVEAEVTISLFSLKVVSPDNTHINLRERFETLSFYSSKVIEEVQKCDGTVISITSTGVAAIFTRSADDAVLAAEKVRSVLREVNSRRAEDYYPCVLFNISIHHGPVNIGIVGDRNRNDFILISSSVLVAEKMARLGRATNLPVLISEMTESVLSEKLRGRLTLLGRIKLNDFSREVSLYGLITDSERESGLELLDEAPVLTQREADKYINL